MILQLQAIKANAEAVVASVNAMLAGLVSPSPAEPQPCSHAAVVDAGSTMGNPRAYCRTCNTTFVGDAARQLLNWG